MPYPWGRTYADALRQANFLKRHKPAEPLSVDPTLPGRPVRNEVPKLVSKQQEELGMSGSGSGQPHILDKLDLLHELGLEFDHELEQDADRLAARYAEVKEKKDKVFERQHSALVERDNKLDQIDARLDRLSNLGNSSGNSKALSNGGETKKLST